MSAKSLLSHTGHAINVLLGGTTDMVFGFAHCRVPKSTLTAVSVCDVMSYGGRWRMRIDARS